ncbi:Putative Tumor susceptibility protein [[Torrubiella] hemipterigena]|uniref:Putative Tumor susceptibility protein n=1 Tax=[Torrubiella] hemipterigena TaxID=1531966 RepID=A0A0A1TI53_9HYPO|nr:Putative Tumor susceptibility protein [[Torrubiella] hemipterigena]
MPVQQHVLNWLYSVLTSEYHDVNRCYDDVAQVLTRYPSLSPRTDVHTFSNGSSALLLHLSGTIPVNFRGNTYRFPLSVWVPHAYPREPPLIYVTPTETMTVRPGQHVDPQGQVYHPYLVGWAQFWDKSTLQDFMAILTDVFAKEPPVVARQQGRPTPATPSQIASPPPPPPPRLSQDTTARPNEYLSSTTSASTAGPRPPPKSPHHAIGSSLSAGPPQPPLPKQTPQSRIPSRYESAPPLPPQTHLSHQQPPPPPGSRASQHPVAYQSPPEERHHPSASLQHSIHGNQPMELQAVENLDGAPSYSQGQWTPVRQTGAWGSQQEQSVQGNQDHGRHPVAYHNHGSVPFSNTQPQQHQPPPPPADLLLDDPLTLDIPPPSIVKAPPIPPNPEKDALLRQLAYTLAAMRQQSRQQNESSMAGLNAQRAAMTGAISALQSEASQLTQLSNVLTSNTNILHDAMHKADAIIDGSRNHSKPDIDELLVAPTVVANQLYALVAEERALGDAIFMLGRALEKGKITPAVFAKRTRSLAREWYLKKALAKKIGEGMGMLPARV